MSAIGIHPAQVDTFSLSRFRIRSLRRASSGPAVPDPDCSGVGSALCTRPLPETFCFGHAVGNLDTFFCCPLLSVALTVGALSSFRGRPRGFFTTPFCGGLFLPEIGLLARVGTAAPCSLCLSPGSPSHSLSLATCDLHSLPTVDLITTVVSLNTEVIVKGPSQS